MLQNIQNTFILKNTTFAKATDNAEERLHAAYFQYTGNETRKSLDIVLFF